MYEKIYEWLCCEAQKRDVKAIFQFHRADPQGQWLDLPVYISNEDFDTVDRVEFLQEVEDSWNDQSPKPEIQVYLKPTKRSW